MPSSPNVYSNVLFVGGYGRSGSTIIDLLLSRVKGVTVLGEVRHLFGRTILDDELCNCGKTIRKCDYWNEIISNALTLGYSRETIDNSMKTVNRVLSTRQVMNPRWRSKDFTQKLDIYISVFNSVYKTASDLSGSKLLIDSSKYPLHLLAMNQSSSINSRNMLLIRDPRAVAYSWTKPKVRTEIHHEVRLMPKYNVVRSALAWNVSNSLTKKVKNFSDYYRVQKYEDFIIEPLTQVNEIVDFSMDSKIKINDDIFTDNGSGELHRIAGNPLDSDKKNQEIKINPTDNKWKEKLSSRQKSIIKTICRLQMKEYGYR